MQSSQDRTGTRRTLDLAQRLGADRHLQAEIDQAMADLVETSPSSLGHNLARVLCAILEPAWAEHTSFQDDALFPILARTGAATADTHELLDRLGREHEEIGARQVEVVTLLNTYAGSRYVADGRLVVSLSQVIALRRSHHGAEAALEGMIPSELAPADRIALDRWLAGRADPPFPLNLILGA